MGAADPNQVQQFSQASGKGGTPQQGGGNVDSSPWAQGARQNNIWSALQNPNAAGQEANK